MKLSKLQEEIVNATEPYIAVVAAAAAGKTTVLTERVRKMLRDGINPKDIVVITFTNLAAQELQDRLENDYKNGIFIGTIHGLANYFLLSRGVDTSKIINDKEFDELFTLVKNNPQCIKHYKYLLLDESQDTSQSEYDFIFKMINPDNFFVVGDYRQSIYSFKGSNPELFDKLINRPDVKVYQLNKNYRNGNNILNFAKKILEKGYLTDNSIPMRNGGLVYEGLPDINNVRQWIDRHKPYSDWAILCNTNKDIAFIRARIKEFNIPSITFKQGEVDKSQLEELMKTDAVKVLTRHSAKGLEFPNVVVWEPSWWSKNGDEIYRVNYVAATRAKDVLLWLEAVSKNNSKNKKKKKQRSKWF